jgi:hypothetical protein
LLAIGKRLSQVQLTGIGSTGQSSCGVDCILDA